MTLRGDVNVMSRDYWKKKKISLQILLSWKVSYIPLNRLPLREDEIAASAFARARTIVVNF